MPNQTLSPGASQGYIGLQDAPGADLSFDDLFPPEGSVPAPPQAVAQGTNPPQEPQSPVVQQPFLKAGESVYNTAEDAAKGIEHKDALVSRYRAFLQEQGFDPNTLQSTRQTPQAHPEQPASPFQYYGNGKKFYEALGKAVSANDAEAYERIQSAYQSEATNAALAPYAPLLAEVSRQRAIRQVAQEIPEFEQFVSSQDFRAVQDRLPMLREAVEATETNPAAAERLKELYQITYLINQGLKSQSRPDSHGTPSQAVNTAPTARPTQTNATMTPPPPGVATTNWATNRDARKQLIQDTESRGGDNLDWRKLGL